MHTYIWITIVIVIADRYLPWNHAEAMLSTLPKSTLDVCREVCPQFLDRASSGPHPIQKGGEGLV
jgi:hypothetical protein